jgi:alpha-amylase/alpha-mannosidase (GH57 family)
VLRFVFGVHFHQPVGNFDHVLEQHVRDVYRPFLERLREREFFPIVLHISGPLIEWLEAHDPAYLDRLGELAADGRAELLLSGFYEPVLAALPRADRLEQVAWMREAIQRRFGVDPVGLWLTERVWEPELAADLAAAGVRYALVDDRHFLISGFDRGALHTPFWTESDGRGIALFPIDERLRYLVPFQPPEATAAYLQDLSVAGRQLAVLVDDGEKFGGWPGTKEWVYERGWLTRFLDTMTAVLQTGTVRLSTLTAALEAVPSGGIAYLPTASYREMEAWALFPDAARRLARVEQDLGAERLAGPDSALIRGAHWRNFLVKYPESNRLHKKMQALSQLCRSRGDPPTARRAIGRAQCNDAYWHGVFGGLYLPHLRSALWRNLALAERELRHGESLSVQGGDIDGDGFEELWVHSGRFSAIVSPHRGGAIEEYTVFDREVNYADVLTRRREAYHESAVAQHDHGGQPEPGAAPSIHDIEKGVRLERLPPVDLDDRALILERVLPDGLDSETYARAEYQPIVSWARAPFTAEIEHSAATVEIVLRTAAPVRMEKRIRFAEGGAITVTYRWDARTVHSDGVFAPEISLAQPLMLRHPGASEAWEFAITTVAKSERGLDETIQGRSITPRWPATVGEAQLEFEPR